MKKYLFLLSTLTILLSTNAMAIADSQCWGNCVQNASASYCNSACSY